jgi:hypothetical protein
MTLTPEERALYVKLGRKFGHLGGHARAAALSPKRRSEIARIAGSNSWKNKRAAEAKKEATV